MDPKFRKWCLTLSLFDHSLRKSASCSHHGTDKLFAAHHRVIYLPVGRKISSRTQFPPASVVSLHAEPLLLPLFHRRFKNLGSPALLHDRDCSPNFWDLKCVNEGNDVPCVQPLKGGKWENRVSLAWLHCLSMTESVPYSKSYIWCCEARGILQKLGSPWIDAVACCKFLWRSERETHMYSMYDILLGFYYSWSTVFAWCLDQFIFK